MKNIIIQVAVLLGSSVAVVACGGGGTATFNKLGGTPSDKVLDACEEKIPSSKAKALGGEDVQVCAYHAPENLSEEEKKSLESSSLPAGEHYQAVAIPVQAEVLRDKAAQKDDNQPVTPTGSPTKGPMSEEERAKEPQRTETTADRRALKITVRARLELNGENATTHEKEIKALIETGCLTKIKDIWKRARKKVNLDVKVLTNGEEAEADDAESGEQILQIVSNGEDENKQPQIALALWPFHSSIPVNAAKLCSDSCTSSGETGNDLKACRRNCVIEKTNPLCQSLARLSAHWLGIQDPLAADSCKMPSSGVHPAAAKNSLVVGYIKKSSAPVHTEAAQTSSADQSTSDDSQKPAAQDNSSPSTGTINADNFWSTAKVELDDVKRVLAPMCADPKVAE